MICKTLYLGACLLSIAIPYSSPGQTHSSKAAGEISALLHAQANAWNDGDIERYMDGYWKSDSLVFTSGGSVERGWNATLRKYKARYDTKEKMGILEFSGLEIRELSDSSAWVLGRWKLRRTGGSPGGVFTLILRKFGDGWKIIHDHTSSAPGGDVQEKKR